MFSAPSNFITPQGVIGGETNEMESPSVETVDHGAAARAAADSAAALDLVSESLAFVKTVKNGDWLRFLNNLKHSEPRFRTSFSLLPPSGRMHLYGSLESQCTGLIFDRRALELSGALCWPSGYFAKTENNLHIEANGEVRLSGGRFAKLVSIDELVAANAAADAARSSNVPYPVAVGAHVPLFNEINTPHRSGMRGLSAVFVRGPSSEAALFAMGVRAMIQHLFPALPPLGLVRLSHDSDAIAVGYEEQLSLMRSACCHSALSIGLPSALFAGPEAPLAPLAPIDPPSPTRGGADAPPRLPVDASPYPDLAVAERLGLHIAHGIGRRSLRIALGEVARAGPDRLAPFVATMLCAAAEVENVASARELVRTAAPLLLQPLLEMTHRTGANRTGTGGGGQRAMRARTRVASAARLTDGSAGEEGARLLAGRSDDDDDDDHADRGDVSSSSGMCSGEEAHALDAMMDEEYYAGESTTVRAWRDAEAEARAEAEADAANGQLAACVRPVLESVTMLQRAVRRPAGHYHLRPPHLFRGPV